MESTNIADAAPLVVDATNPLNQAQRDLSDEVNTKLNLENQNEKSEKVHNEADSSSSSSEYYTTSDDSSDYSDAEEEEEDDSSDYSDAEEEEGAMIVDPQPQPPRPITTGGPRTLFIANLPFHVKKSDIKEFFQEAGEVVEVKFAMGRDGSFRGFGHILFASPEEAQQALGFHRRTFLGREIVLDMARES